MPESEITFERWVKYLFDHPVTERKWYFTEDPEYLYPTPLQTVRLITETFERSEELLMRYSDEQLNQGFDYLISASDHMCELDEATVPIEIRLRAIRSIFCIFEQVMAVRCFKSIQHEQNPLGSVCFMWWDALRIGPRPDDLDCRERDEAVLIVLQKILAIPNDACRESALHGIGEWVSSYRMLGKVVTKFLAAHPDLDRDLAAYAVCARVGMVE